MECTFLIRLLMRIQVQLINPSVSVSSLRIGTRRDRMHIMGRGVHNTVYSFHVASLEDRSCTDPPLSHLSPVRLLLDQLLVGTGSPYLHWLWLCSTVVCRLHSPGCKHTKYVVHAVRMMNLAFPNFGRQVRIITSRSPLCRFFTHHLHRRPPLTSRPPPSSPALTPTDRHRTSSPHSTCTL
jgi:hypothetical protein